MQVRALALTIVSLSLSFAPTARASGRCVDEVLATVLRAGPFEIPPLEEAALDLFAAYQADLRRALGRDAPPLPRNASAGVSGAWLPLARGESGDRLQWALERTNRAWGRIRSRNGQATRRRAMAWEAPSATSARLLLAQLRRPNATRNAWFDRLEQLLARQQGANASARSIRRGRVGAGAVIFVVTNVFYYYLLNLLTLREPSLIDMGPGAFVGAGLSLLYGWTLGSSGIPPALPIEPTADEVLRALTLRAEPETPPSWMPPALAEGIDSLENLLTGHHDELAYEHVGLTAADGWNLDLLARSIPGYDGISRRFALYLWEDDMRFRAVGP